MKTASISTSNSFRQTQWATHAHSFQGFTLLELLVTIAVLGVLAGVALPVLGRAVDRAESATCVGNLRQWGLATALYAGDNGDLLPADGAPNGISTARAWYADLPPVLGMRPYHEEGAWRTNASAPTGTTLWICPSNPRRSNGHLLFHYCLNRELNGQGDSTLPRRLSGIPSPYRTAWLFDNGGRAASAGRSNLGFGVHGTGANLLAVDGSVRWHRPTSETSDPAGNDPIWNIGSN